ncbi:NAD(P)/FAD-dependent oxidoreductase [Kaistia adipata]|uniref:NAD(P)/FAD-dependent oxidoreductase n=1 Tax=Kaistia adipata TaxID=166954 RepID=UPI00041A8057|nr:FAD-dependent oxidoreductase [Kaistia adipata]
MVKTVDAIVIGGGIVGAMTAATLARRGLAVHLLERGAFGGAVSGGSLACINAHMNSLDELETLKWCGDAWAGLDDRLGHSFEYNRSGKITFILRQADVARAEAWIAAETPRGVAARLLTPAEVRDVEPGLTGPIVAATWHPEAATVNPFFAVRAMLADAADHGATMASHTAVDRILVQNGKVRGVATATGTVEAPHVVIAAGPWTADVAATAGVTLPIVPRKAQCLATTAQPPTILRVIGACESDGGIEAGYTQIQQARSGQILFNTVLSGGQGDPSGRNAVPEVDRRFVFDSIEMLMHLFPATRGIELMRSWVRYEAVTPDDRFVIGPAGPEGLLIAAGDGGTGFVRSPAIAEIIADRIEGRESHFRTDIYAPSRFDALVEP